MQEGIDVVKFLKKDSQEIFNELNRLNLLGSRAGEVLFISESGFWKLVMQSRKTIGIQTRHWLASEVLPSIRKTGKYEIEAANPLASFTERTKQVQLSKDVNAIIQQNNPDKDAKEYAKFWNELHTIVTGMTAKEILALYKGKGSAKEVLRVHAPHLEATEAVIEDIWKKGVGLEKIKDSNLHKDLSSAFQKMLSLGVDLKKLGK